MYFLETHIKQTVQMCKTLISSRQDRCFLKRCKKMCHIPELITSLFVLIAKCFACLFGDLGIRTLVFGTDFTLINQKRNNQELRDQRWGL